MGRLRSSSGLPGRSSTRACSARSRMRCRRWTRSRHRSSPGCWAARAASGGSGRAHNLPGVAGGRYMVDDAQLKRLRDAIAADRSGKELVGIVAALRKKGYEVEGQELKRVPPPYPQDHPRADLLRHKRLFYWRRWPVEPWIATARARERVAQVWRDGKDLEAWMARHLDRD